MLNLHCEEMFWGRTFDSFSWRPQHSVVQSRSDISDLSMPLTRQLKINLPFVGANMDTVIGSRMMKTLSLEGAFGFLPRNGSIDQEVGMVREVKRQHAYKVAEPVVLPCLAPIGDAIGIINRNQASGILIEETKGSGILAGVLSQRDIPWDKRDLGMDMPVYHFMTSLEHLVTAPEDVSLEEAEKLLFENKIEKLPLIDKDCKIKGLITARDLKLYHSKPLASRDGKGRFLVGAAIGATGDYLGRAESLIAAGADCIVIDIADGDSVVMERAVRSFRQKFGDFPLVGGNVATYAGAQFLAEVGVDAIKVGIGPGRGCRTRLETKVGVPQLQAIREAYCAVQGRLPIIADGGIREDGDIAMAIGCGASAVMLGSKLAGTEESPGTVFMDPKTKVPMKRYRGMTSPQATLDNIGEAAAHIQPQEGQSEEIPYKGSVVPILQSIAGHLRSFVSYMGVTTLREAHNRMTANPTAYLNPLDSASRRESYER